MAGPAKNRARNEKPPASSSGDSSSASRDPTQRSIPKSIPRLDGNRDPAATRIPTEYSKPTDLKNISEALGLGGWYAARGVSTTSFIPLYAASFPYPARTTHSGYVNASDMLASTGTCFRFLLLSQSLKRTKDEVPLFMSLHSHKHSLIILLHHSFITSPIP